MDNLLSCFKAYDVRGVVPDELNEDLTYRIGAAYADVVKPKAVVVGKDVRPSGHVIVSALTDGLNDKGVHVIDIGVCGTEQVYFATAHLGLDGGIMVTASHNPPEYNGLKMVRENAIPISSTSGLKHIEQLAHRATDLRRRPTRHLREEIDITDDYVEHLMTYIDPQNMKRLTIACNPGNGSAGPIIKKLASRLPFHIVSIHDDPDGTFPNGGPNPMLPEHQRVTSALVKKHGADMGIAWDGDFDRCFFFDEAGNFVEGYYVVGILAQALLKQFPGGKIIHDPKLTWNTLDMVQAAGGKRIQCRAGHTFIKEMMRAEDAVYGGEVSAHHYFKTFYYCDSGMIPWLIMANILSESKMRLSRLITERANLYPVSGEINRKVGDAKHTLKLLEKKYVTDDATVDRSDGLGINYKDWRFNVRLSNTEPLMRLNVEARNDRHLMQQKTEEILSIIDSLS